MTRLALAIVLAAGIVAGAASPGLAAPSKSSSSPPQGPTFKAPAQSPDAPPPAAKGPPAPAPESNVKAPPPPPPASPPASSPPSSPPPSSPPSPPPSSSPSPSPPALEPVFQLSPSSDSYPESGGSVIVSPGGIGTSGPSTTLSSRGISSSFAGRFRSDASGDIVTIRRTREGNYYLTGPDWEGVGFLDGRTYRGVFRFGDTPRDSAFADLTGWHFIDFDGDELAVQSEVENEDRDHFDDTWVRVPPAGEPVGRLDEPRRANEVKPASAVGKGGDRLPEFGEYVEVEELPEAITKVPPSYPDEARAAKSTGTVMVQALVLADGTVGDTRVVKSVPLLDDAAIAAVRQWRFKPAQAKGRPVAVWVAVPVKFSIH